MAAIQSGVCANGSGSRQRTPATAEGPKSWESAAPLAARKAPPAMASEPESQLGTINERVSGFFRSAGLPVAQETTLAVARAYQDETNLKNFAQRIAKDVVSAVFNCPAVSIFLTNQAEDRLDRYVTTDAQGKQVHHTIWYEKGEGCTGWVWEQVRSLRIPGDARDKTRHAELLAGYVPTPTPVMKSFETLPAGVCPQLLIVPIMAGEKFVGALRLCGRKDGLLFSPDDEKLALDIAGELGPLVVKRRNLDRHEQHNHALIRLSEELQHELNEETAISFLLAAITCGKGLGFNRAAVWLGDSIGKNLKPAQIRGAKTSDEAHLVWEEIQDLSFELVLEKAREFATGSDAHVPSALEAQFATTTIPLTRSDHDLLGACYYEWEHARTLGVADLLDTFEGNTIVSNLLEPGTFALAPLIGCEFQSADKQSKTRPSCLGVLYVDNAFDRKPIDHSMLAFLQKFARLAGLALMRIREEKWRQERFDTHQQLTAAIVQGIGAQHRVDRVLEALHFRFGFARWLLYYHDQQTRQVSILGHLGFDAVPEPWSFDTVRTTDVVTPKVVREKEHYFTSKAESDNNISDYWKKVLALRGPLLAYPLRAGDNVYGVLVVTDSLLTQAHVERLSQFENDLATAVSTVVLERGLQRQNRLLELIQKTQTAFVHAFADEIWFLHELAYHVRNITRSSLCTIYRTSPRGTEARPSYVRVVALGYPHPDGESERAPKIGKGAGLTNHVLAGEILRVNNVREDSRWLGQDQVEIEKKLGNHRSFLGVPLRNRLTGTHAATVGAITLTRSRISESDGFAFQDADVALVEAVATAVSSYLTLKDVFRELDRRLSALNGLHAFGQRLTPLTFRGGGKSSPIFEAIAEDALRTFDADLVTVYPYAEGSVVKTLPLAYAGTLRNVEPSLEALRESDAPEQIAALRRAVYEEDIRTLSPNRSDEFLRVVKPLMTMGEGIVAFAATPLVEPTQVNLSGPSDVVGIMLILYRTPRPFGSNERLTIETFASYAALAIHSAKGIARIVQSRENEFEEFYGAVAHRLNNVLVTIPGAIASALGRGEFPSPEVRVVLSDAFDCARRAQGIVQDLQQMSRSRSHQPKERTTSRYLMSELERVVRAEIGSDGKVLTNDCAPEVSLDVNLDRLCDDFRNFANDSVRHRRPGVELNIVLECHLTAAEDVVGLKLRPGSYLRVTYCDNGSGIAADKKELVFQRFYTTAKGMGLGLTLARQNAQDHGGNLWECGNPSEGVQFEVYLPTADAPTTGKGKIE